MEIPPQIELRPYQKGDAADLAGLLSELGYPTEAEAVRARMALLSADHFTIVADCGGQVAGFIGLVKIQAYETPAPLGYILALSVGGTYQRQGLGKALVAAAEEYFRSQGITDIRVSSGLQREEAHLFYEAMGYQKTGYRFRRSIK
ncbi:GNAT family N-acetyltransferase [Luteolibacter luteus]|uniref:GNAT family N-acetyltransferase n=1 Tax=Luteolibacter luteus TaxID=2728835 RepID=A0A858RKX5_9BACT|nr:GNAT family N-acetyltransferase [Luteolibacter luteus]QJE96673.1 GNAT family N-acetyltransferase [Luteolibacter luteus]